MRQKVTFTTWNTAGTTKDNTLTFTSQIATFKIEVCEGVTLTSSLASSYSLQIGATFTPVSINAAQSKSDCPINAGTYLSSSTTSAVALSSSGALSINTPAALALTTFTFTLTVGSPVTVTVTGPAWSVRIFDCLPVITVTDFQAIYQVQLGNTTTWEFPAVSSTAECVVDASSYLVASVKTGQGLSSTGTYSVDAQAAYDANTLVDIHILEVDHQFTVNVGTQTYTSSLFKIELHNCLMNVSYSNLGSVYAANQTDTFPTIDAIATTTNPFCLSDVVTRNQVPTYSLLPVPLPGQIGLTVVDGVSISAEGIISVDTRNPIANTSLMISMTDGYQTYISKAFWIEVIELPFVPEVIFAHLAENITAKEYELEIGKGASENNSIELGKYISNGTTIRSLQIFFFIEEVTYGVTKKEDIDQNLEDLFIVDSIYNYRKSGNVTLKIDLLKFSPLFDGTIVRGNLSLVTNFVDGPIYVDVTFILGYNPPEEVYIPAYEEKPEVKALEIVNCAEDRSRYKLARILHISAIGEIQLQFNESLVDQIHLRQLKQSEMDIYIEPAEGSPVEPGKLNLTWNVTEVKNYILTIQLEFEHPSQISLTEIQDSVVLQFKPKSALGLYSKSIPKDTINPLCIPNLRQKIRKQLSNTASNRGLQGSAQFLKILLFILMVLAFILTIFLKGSGHYYLMLIRSLQIIIHLPILKITVPANVSMVFSFLMPVIQYDIFLIEWTIMGFSDFDYDKQAELSNNMPRGSDQWLDLGYKTHNSMLNLGSMGIFTILYLISLVFFLCYLVWYRFYAKNDKVESSYEGGTFDSLSVAIPQDLSHQSLRPPPEQVHQASALISPMPAKNVEVLPNPVENREIQPFSTRKFKLPAHKIHQIMSKKLIFGVIIVILVETFLEFLLAGYLQLKEPLDTTYGERFGYFFAIFCLVLVLIVIPTLFAYLLTRDRQELAETKFQERWGQLYDKLKIKSKWFYAYFLFFTVRRVIYVVLAVGFPYELRSFQVILMCYMNMFISMYQGFVKPMEHPMHNKIEYFNESVIWLCTVLMMGFTDFTYFDPVEEVHLGVGWVMIVIIWILIVVDLMFVFYFGMKACILIYTKYNKRFDLWFFINYGITFAMWWYNFTFKNCWKSKKLFYFTTNEVANFTFPEASSEEALEVESEVVANDENGMSTMEMEANRYLQKAKDEDQNGKSTTRMAGQVRDPKTTLWLKRETQIQEAEEEKANAANYQMWEIKKIFHRVDADQSGEIDKAEFEAAITADGALGQQTRRCFWQIFSKQGVPSWEHVLETLDEDKNGKISWPEIEGFLKKRDEAYAANILNQDQAESSISVQSSSSNDDERYTKKSQLACGDKIPYQGSLKVNWQTQNQNLPKWLQRAEQQVIREDQNNLDNKYRLERREAKEVAYDDLMQNGMLKVMKGAKTGMLFKKNDADNKPQPAVDFVDDPLDNEDNATTRVQGQFNDIKAKKKTFISGQFGGARKSQVDVDKREDIITNKNLPQKNVELVAASLGLMEPSRNGGPLKQKYSQAQYESKRDAAGSSLFKPEQDSTSNAYSMAPASQMDFQKQQSHNSQPSREAILAAAIVSKEKQARIEVIKSKIRRERALQSHTGEQNTNTDAQLKQNAPQSNSRTATPSDVIFSKPNLPLSSSRYSKEVTIKPQSQAKLDHGKSEPSSTLLAKGASILANIGKKKQAQLPPGVPQQEKAMSPASVQAQAPMDYQTKQQYYAKPPLPQMTPKVKVPEEQPSPLTSFSEIFAAQEALQKMLLSRGAVPPQPQPQHSNENIPTVMPLMEQRTQQPEQSPVHFPRTRKSVPAPLNQFQQASSSNNLSRQQKTNLTSVNHQLEPKEETKNTNEERKKDDTINNDGSFTPFDFGDF